MPKDDTETIASPFVPKHRAPTHPGTMLLEEFIKPFGWTQAEAARRMDVTPQTLSQLIAGKRDLSTAVAQNIAATFGTSIDFWLNLQATCDLYALRDRDLSNVRPVTEEERLAVAG